MSWLVSSNAHCAYQDILDTAEKPQSISKLSDVLLQKAEGGLKNDKKIPQIRFLYMHTNSVPWTDLGGKQIA